MFDQLILAGSRPATTGTGGPIEPGMVFGRLTATPEWRWRGIENGRGRDRQRYCVCACGNEKWVREALLKSGSTRSCGCLARERALEKLSEFNSLPLAARGLTRDPITGRIVGKAN